MELKTTILSIFDGMEMKEATFCQHTFPAHYHDSYSIGIIEKGIERLYIRDNEIPAHAHSVTIINPYEIHANSFYDSAPWKYRALYINSDMMRYMQQKTGLFPGGYVTFSRPLIDDIYLYQLILQFFSAETDKTTHLYHICRYLLIHYARTGPEAHFIASDPITDAVEHFRTHLYEKPDITRVAARYRMDKYKFIRAFTQFTGLTPNSYLLLHRINKSKELITEGMPIVSVALETGFYDQSHFTHYFKKYTGVSPLAYKKNRLII